MLINALVEGALDEAVARRLVDFTGHEFGICYGKRGGGYIKNKIDGFNNAAQSVAILTLLDFADTRMDCPPQAAELLIPRRRRLMLFALAVREIESWLLADRSSIAKFLRVGFARVPRQPEALPDPKRALINVARESRSRAIRDSIVPRARSTAQQGVLYNTELIQFVRNHWDPETARADSPSLDRCLRKLAGL